MSKVSQIRDKENLTIYEYLTCLINYLAVLQDGRTKPDNKNNGGFIRESLYNIDEIEEVKLKINDVLRVCQKPKQTSFTFKDNINS